MEIKKVIVFGAGTMGAGITEWFLCQNIKVELVDNNHNFALKSKENILSNIEKLVSKNKITKNDSENFKSHLSVLHFDQIDKNADLVIEAIIENLEIKKKLFHDLDLVMNKNSILASNTSSFPITSLASNLSIDRKKNFIGLHFFNPAQIMKLVEVINGIETNNELSKKLIHFFNSRGKIACLCSDSPGFIVNRVARNFYGESLRIVKNYDQNKISEVDQVLKSVGGFKMGPFELMDLIGIDINYSVTESVYKAFFDEARFKPHRLQKEMVDANRLGKKTKQGFYSYES